MSRAGNRRRGQPLVFYALLLLGWTGLRVLTWESPLPQRLVSLAEAAAPVKAIVPHDTDPAETVAAPVAAPETGPDSGSGRNDWRIAPPLERELAPLLESAVVAAVRPVADPEFAEGRVAAAHQLMWLAAMAQLPVPRSLAESASAAAQPALRSPLAEASGRPTRRWSLDSWIFLREGSGGTARTAGLRPVYGASQEGAVVRYRLAEADGHLPSLYARFARALAGSRDTDLAAGVEARPIPALPLALHAELRATRHDGRTDWRPSAFATGGVHMDLPGRIQLRGYGQAGYVGGGFATAFADGQLVADREVAIFDLTRSKRAGLRLGAGVWGGSQKGSERLDVGPSANLTVPVADAPVRLSLDYRIRAAGDAEPGSGVALTLSTGF